MSDPAGPPRKISQFIFSFWPAPLRVNTRERLRVIFGAGLAILVTGFVSRWWTDPGVNQIWLIGSVGASALLVFAVPTSPLAQPWPVIGGNTLSAVIGTLCAINIPSPIWAGAAAVAISIGLMFRLRCLHPPGGGAALFAALGATSFSVVVHPMLVNSVLLVLAGVIYNGLTGRRYPHAQARQPGTDGKAGHASAADLDAALSGYNQVLDVSRDVLESLLQSAQVAAYQRNFGDLRCADIMAHAPPPVQPDTPLDEAWALMRQHRVKALPVINEARRITGIVTVSDFMRHISLDQHEGIGQRLKAFLRSGARTAEKPKRIEQIMTRDVSVANEHLTAGELVPLFSEGGHRHIPVVDDERRLVGIIAESDLVRALYRAAKPEE